MEYKTKIAAELAFKQRVRGVALKLVDRGILEDNAWLDAMLDGDDRLADAMEAFHCSIAQQLAEDVLAAVDELDSGKQKRLEAVFSAVLEALGGMHRHPVISVGKAWKTAVKTLAEEAMKCSALDSDFPGWR